MMNDSAARSVTPFQNTFANRAASASERSRAGRRVQPGLYGHTHLDYPAEESTLAGGTTRTMQDDAISSLDDVQLMGRLAGGDRSALAALVKRHQHRVLEIAYRTTGDRVLAEDIAQEAFLRVWRSAGRYQPSAKFSTWLYRIVVNLCIDAFKKQKALGSEPFEVVGARLASPSAQMEREDRAAAVRRAIAQLPQRQRVALVMHRFSGLSIRGVSDATGWSESAVESLLVRAYAWLRQALTDIAES